MGSFHLPPAVSIPSARFHAPTTTSTLPPPRTAYGRLGLSPGYSVIRGRHRRPTPCHRIASQRSPRPSLYPSPRRRIASQPSPRPHCGSVGHRFAKDQEPTAARTHGDLAGHRFVQEQDPAAAPPHGVPVGHRFVQGQDPAAASIHCVPVGTRFVQDLASNSPCSVSVGCISTFDHIAESPSSSEKAAVVTGAPPGFDCKPPVISPSSTSGVSTSIFPRASVSTSPRASSGLVSSRTRNRSAAAAGIPRTPAD